MHEEPEGSSDLPIGHSRFVIAYHPISQEQLKCPSVLSTQSNNAHSLVEGYKASEQS